MQHAGPWVLLSSFRASEAAHRQLGALAPPVGGRPASRPGLFRGQGKGADESPHARQFASTAPAQEGGYQRIPKPRAQGTLKAGSSPRYPLEAKLA